jgi:major membrane immunogen (membrane-anchored lipoprotein)
MRFINRRVGLVVMAGIIVAAGAFAQGKRVALIIGNAAYPAGPLQNPVNDAKDVAAALKQVGFEVFLGTNADRRSMYDLIDRFGDQIHGADIALFYYSGHGVQVGGDNFLIPIDAHIKVASDVEVDGVGLQRVVGRMMDGGAGTNAIILDACRDNPFPKASRGMDKGLAVVAEKPPESIIVYATEVGQTADDGSGRNGVFTGVLLQNITRDEEFTTILRDVNAEVRKETNQKQKPAKYDNLTHAVYLTGKGPAQTSLLVSLATAGTLEVAGKKLPISAGDTLPVTELPSGDYVLKVTYDDGKTESRGVTIEGGKATKVSFDYQRGSLIVSLKTAGTLDVGGKKFPLTSGEAQPVKELAPGDYVLRVTYDDGKTESRMATVQGGKTIPVSFEYQRGSLAISAVTAGTLDFAGKKLAVSAGDTVPVPDVSPGDYILKMTYADGKTESHSITVESGKSLAVSFQYKPGGLTVSLATAGVLEVGGKKLQVAAGDTVSVSDIAPGDYVLRVTYDDGTSDSKGATVVEGNTIQVTFDYRPAASQANLARGSVMLKGIPGNVKEIVVTSKSDPLSAQHITVGYDQTEQLQNLLADDETTIVFKTAKGLENPFSLKVTPIAHQEIEMTVPSAWLQIPYLPPKSKMFLNGEPLNPVPSTYWVLARKYDVRVSYPGTSDFAGTVEVNPDQDSPVNIPVDCLREVYTAERNEQAASLGRRNNLGLGGWAGMLAAAAGLVGSGASYYFGTQAYSSFTSLNSSDSSRTSALSEVKLLTGLFYAGLAVGGAGIVTGSTLWVFGSREPVKNDLKIKRLNQLIQDLGSSNGGGK